jgi:predicted SAM-dependent methyltransferase
MKLDICGGNTKIYKDFLNVDGKPGPKVDIVADIRKELPFKDEEVEEILSVATLEHLTLEQAKRLVREFCRVLKKGGKLTVAVPDMSKICHAYVEGKYSFEVLNQYFYGQLFEYSFMEYDCHKSVYDFKNLYFILFNAGFDKIEQVEYDFPMHKKELMLKVICKKP